MSLNGATISTPVTRCVHIWWWLAEVGSEDELLSREKISVPYGDQLGRKKGMEEEGRKDLSGRGMNQDSQNTWQELTLRREQMAARWSGSGVRVCVGVRVHPK